MSSFVDLKQATDLRARSPKADGAVRYDFIDNAKAIAIVLVVLGHSPGLPLSLKTFIYGFHIPLFFFLSGTLISRAKLSLPFRPFLRYIARSLLLPYVFFFALSYVCWLVLRHFAPQREFSGTSTLQALLGFITGTEESLVVNKVLWFLPCLAVVSLMYYLLRKKLSARVLAGASVALALIAFVAFPHLPARIPFGFDCALVALTFYATGQLFREAKFPGPRRLVQQIAGFLGMFLLTMWLSHWNGLVDLSKLNFGRNPAVYLVCSYLGIAMAIWIAMPIPASKILRWLSANTLVIFPTHPLMFSVFTGMLTLLFHIAKETKDSSVLFTVAYAALAIGLAYPLAILLRMMFPSVFRAHPR